METQASARFIMISPRKARLVATAVRGFSYAEAVDILRFMPQKAAALILKLLYSARANVKVSAPETKEASLYISKLYVDGGPVLKRFRAQARGRGAARLRRTSNITLVLSDSAGS